MKKLLTTLCLVLLVSCSPPDVPSHRLVQNGGLTYEVGSNDPYTGVSSTSNQDGQLGRKKEYEKGIELSDTIFIYHDNGQLWTQENYKKGERHGLQEWLYENGQLDYRENWKDGKEDGLFEGYHENGQLRSRENYKDGELDGLQEGYHENGQLVERRNYKNGKKDGLWEKYNKYNGDILKTEEYKNGVLQE